MANVKYGFTPTHPGEVLKDEIIYRGISQRELAERMGMSYKVLNDLLNGRRSLTATTAMMFEAALDIPSESLMRLQLKYSMQLARNDQPFMERLTQIRKYGVSGQSRFFFGLDSVLVPCKNQEAPPPQAMLPKKSIQWKMFLRCKSSRQM